MFFFLPIPKGNVFHEIQTSWKWTLAGKYHSQCVFYTKENLNATELRPQWLVYYTAAVFHHYFIVELGLAVKLNPKHKAFCLHFCPKSWKRTTSGNRMARFYRHIPALRCEALYLCVSLLDTNGIPDYITHIGRNKSYASTVIWWRRL